MKQICCDIYIYTYSFGLQNTKECPMTYVYLLYEYRDLFIDMDVRNNRSDLAIANRHQEQ